MTAFHIHYLILGVIIHIGCHAQRFRSPWLHDIASLQAESDYRAVTLRWNYRFRPKPSGFKVQVCELSSWSSKTLCKYRHLSLDGENLPGSHDILKPLSNGRFEAVIYDLRMLTNYSFAVEPEFIKNSLLYANFDDDRLQMITSENVLVSTKGFTAKATRCLPDISDVVVNTGPFFMGKISVEDATDNSCMVYGDPNSPQEVYVLKINHTLCGSRILNYSRIETNIIVHENRDIITHNTRRYLVVCNFYPETFMVKASVNIPSLNSPKNLLHRSLLKTDTQDVFTYQHYKDNNIKDSRIVEEAKHEIHSPEEKSETSSGSDIAVMVFLTTVAIFGCLIFVGWMIRSSRKKTCFENKEDNYVTLRQEKEPPRPAVITLRDDQAVTLVSISSVSEA